MAADGAGTTEQAAYRLGEGVEEWLAERGEEACRTALRQGWLRRFFPYRLRWRLGRGAGGQGAAGSNEHFS